MASLQKQIGSLCEAFFEKPQKYSFWYKKLKSNELTTKGSSHWSRYIYKQVFLKTSDKVTEKYLYWNLFFNKVVGPVILWKRNSATDVFL